MEGGLALPVLAEESWLNSFPARIRSVLMDSTPQSRQLWQEIRLRPGQPLQIITARGEICLDPYGGPGSGGRLVTVDDLQGTFQLMAQHSVYALEEELRRGFLTIPGGHRLGFSGRVLLDRGRIHMLREISSLNLRLARAVPGTGLDVLPFLVEHGRLCSTMILSPPRCGKTTLLRDLVRLVSTGLPSLGLPGQQVSLVDERSEVAGTYLGQAQLDIGPRTDVLDGAPKAEGMLLMLRAMSPTVLATDEIGRAEDVEAVAEAAKAGVAILTTAHAADPEEARQRPVLGQLLTAPFFRRLVVLDAKDGPGTVRGIYQPESAEVNSCSVSWAPCVSWAARAASGS